MAETVPATPAPGEHASRWWHHPLGVSLAVAGGVLGIAGAAVNELRTGGFILLPIIGAPLIEEALKPSGIYILLARWPQALRGQLYTAALTALSGLCFGIIEALAYVLIYVDHPPSWFVTYRFTAPLAMHVTCSFIMGLGINRGMMDWAVSGSPFPRRSRNCYIAAAALHSAFNSAMMALALAGVFPELD